MAAPTTLLGENNFLRLAGLTIAVCQGPVWGFKHAGITHSSAAAKARQLTDEERAAIQAP